MTGRRLRSTLFFEQVHLLTQGDHHILRIGQLPLDLLHTFVEPPFHDLLTVVGGTASVEIVDSRSHDDDDSQPREEVAGAVGVQGDDAQNCHPRATESASGIFAEQSWVISSLWR